jgi:FUS-interacting serine-arginine-rich protein 1
MTTEDLTTAFGRIGDVRDVYIPRDYHSQQPKGFAFIEYANPEMALEAREEMDRFKIKGRELEVVFAQERRKTPGEMRGRSGPTGPTGGGGGGNPRGGGGGGGGPPEFERSSSFERHRQRQRDGGGGGGGRDRRDRGRRDSGDRRDGPRGGGDGARGGESSKGEKDVRANESKPDSGAKDDEWV